MGVKLLDFAEREDRRSSEGLKVKFADLVNANPVDKPEDSIEKEKQKIENSSHDDINIVSFKRSLMGSSLDK